MEQFNLASPEPADRSHRFTVETGKDGYNPACDPEPTGNGSSIFPPGITMIKAAESALGPPPPRIAEAAAKIGIRFDGSWFNTVAGGASGVWHDWATNHASDFPGWPGVSQQVRAGCGGRKPHTLFPIPLETRKATSVKEIRHG